MQDDVEAIAKYVAAHADVNGKNDAGNTPMHTAAILGKTAALQKLYELGGDLNARRENALGKGDGVTPLMLAASSEQPQAVEMLLALGAKVNEQDNNGRTALFHAAENGSYKALTRLLKEPLIEVNLANLGGDTPLHKICEQRHRPGMFLLIEAGGIPSFENKKGVRPMDLAREKGDLKALNAMIEQCSAPHLAASGDGAAGDGKHTAKLRLATLDKQQLR
jgi:ankyrin repeat protein